MCSVLLLKTLSDSSVVFLPYTVCSCDSTNVSGASLVVAMSEIQVTQTQRCPRYTNTNTNTVSSQILKGFRRRGKGRHYHSCRCVNRYSDVAPTVNDLPQVVRVKGCCNRNRCEHHQLDPKVSGREKRVTQCVHVFELHYVVGGYGFTGW